MPLEVRLAALSLYYVETLKGDWSTKAHLIPEFALARPEPVDDLLSFDRGAKTLCGVYLPVGRKLLSPASSAEDSLEYLIAGGVVCRGCVRRANDHYQDVPWMEQVSGRLLDVTHSGERVGFRRE